MILRLRFKHVLLILLVGIGGLAAWFLTHKQKMLNLILPEITEITLIKADIHSDTAFIEVNAIAVNNAPYPMNIDSIISDLSLGGTRLISTKQYIGLHLKSKESSKVKFSVKVPISHTRNKIQSLQSKDSTGITLHATIVYSGRKLNFNKGKKIEVPVPPQLSIRTQKKEIKLFKKDAKVDLFLKIVNDGKNLNLDIEDLQYELSIGNDLATKGKFEKDVHVKPQTSTELKLPLDFEMKNPAGTIFKVATDTDRVPFKLKLSGYLDAGKMKRIPVVIFAKGKLEIVNEQKKKAEKKAKKAAEKKAEKRR